MNTPTLRERNTTLLWGPSRYSERSVMLVEVDEVFVPSWSRDRRARVEAFSRTVDPSARAVSGRRPDAVAFVARTAAALVAAALGYACEDIPSPAGEPGAVVFQVPLYAIGRFAFLHAVELWTDLLANRPVSWAASQARARTWPTDTDRRVVELMTWAQSSDVAVRPLQPPVLWTVGEGALATTFRADRKRSLSTVARMFEQQQLARVPVIAVAGQHGKTACGRALALAFTHWSSAFAYAGDVDLEDGGADGASGLPRDPRANLVIAEAPVPGRRGAGSLRYDQAHVTIIVNTGSPAEDKAGPTARHERYRHYLDLARRTRPGGMVVLNADDELTRRLAEDVEDVKVVLFSGTGHARGRRRGGRLEPVVCFRDGQVLARVGGEMRPQFPIAPFGSVGGLPHACIDPILAAFATLLPIIRPRAVLVDALTRFQTTAAVAPGWFNLHRIRGARILVHRAGDLTGHQRLWSEVQRLVAFLRIERIHMIHGTRRGCPSAERAAVLDLYAGCETTTSVDPAPDASRRRRGRALLASLDDVPAHVRARLTRLGPSELLVVATPDISALNQALSELAYR